MGRNKEEIPFNIFPDEVRPLVKTDIAEEQMTLSQPSDSYGGTQKISKYIHIDKAKIDPTASVFTGADKDRRSSAYLGEIRSELTEYGVTFLWGSIGNENDVTVCIAPPDFFDE